MSVALDVCVVATDTYASVKSFNDVICFRSFGVAATNDDGTVPPSSSSTAVNNSNNSSTAVASIDIGWGDIVRRHR